MAALPAQGAIVLLLLLLSSVSAHAQWPFPSPRAAATPFQGFDDSNSQAQAGEPARDIPLIEKPFGALSDQRIDDLGQKALAIRPKDWKHSETDNFILHYRRVTEARKVAREVEYDLWFVATRLGATRAQYQRKSHVFIFQDDKEWKEFLSQTSVNAWAISFAHGDELFLNLRNTGGGSEPFDSRTLAHETTHAVVARLYPNQRWPVWLNEGFAEYMGAASVAARKGQTVRRHEYMLTAATMSLDQLQALQKYPEDPVQVMQLYETAEKLIRFMMTELPKERFTQFAAAVSSGQPLPAALHGVYGDKIPTYAEFQRRFARFTK